MRLPSTVTNSGTMTGRVSGSWHKFGLGTLVVVNTETITSPNYAILGGDSTDLITNQGMMNRIVDLGAGNDVLDNRGGTIIPRSMAARAMICSGRPSRPRMSTAGMGLMPWICPI